METETPAVAGAHKIEFTNRELVSLIAPLIAEQFLAILVGLADSLMVATVGDAAISAVSIGLARFSLMQRKASRRTGLCAA